MGWGTVSYKKKLKSLYILSKKCPDGHKKSLLLIFVMQIQLRYQKLLCFYAPGLKGPPGASSNLIVCLSVIPSRFQTKFNNSSLGEDTVTKLGL